MKLLFLFLLLNPQDTLKRDTAWANAYQFNIIVTNTITGKKDTTSSHINGCGTFIFENNRRKQKKNNRRNRRAWGWR